MSECYDRNGAPISWEQWSILHRNMEYKRVKLTECDDCSVSTVWLGLNHNFSGSGPPIIFETMIFGGEHDQEQWRWATEKDSIEGHDRIINQLTAIEGTTTEVPKELNP